MRIGHFEGFGSPPVEYDPDFFKAALVKIATHFTEQQQVIDGILGFGDGTDADNIVGKWLTYSTNASADTEDTVGHTLGVVPVGIMVMVPPQAGFIYKGTTAWTTSNIYLKCSAAAQSATLFLLAPSQGLIT